MKIAESLLEALKKEARAAHPKECCGILWREQSGSVEACSSYPGRLEPDRFELPDEWLLKEFLKARRQGRKAAGFYHSHPEEKDALYPSRADLIGHPPGSLCLILDGWGEQARLFRLDSLNDEIEEIKIEAEHSTF